MVKTIKFDLPIDGVKVPTLDDLREHFTTEIIGHFRSGLLARWLRSRNMTGELAGTNAVSLGDYAAILKELCQVFAVEATDDAIAAAVAEPTGAPGTRPNHMRSSTDKFRDCPEGPELVVVPAGSFMMGSPDEEGGRDLDEGPLHEVKIAYALAVGVYAVTFDEWDACVSDGGCGGHRPEDYYWGRESRAVIDVCWEDAQMYLKWSTWKTGMGYRLLNEAEWEYVARAGTRTRYWLGDGIGRNRANCDGCASRWYDDRTAPVGSFSANAFGLYDVHGNVQEWVEGCWSGNTGYHGAPEDGSARVSEDCDCDSRVVRGGSWSQPPANLRSGQRDYWSATSRHSGVGFRVARTVAP